MNAESSTKHIWLCVECGVRINTLYKRLCPQCARREEAEKPADDFDNFDSDGYLIEEEETPEGAVWDAYHGWYIE